MSKVNLSVLGTFFSLHNVLTPGTVYSHLMKRFFLIVILALCASLASAQDITRIVVLPFDAQGSTDTYGFGLATALQRSLNVIDNVYAPPVGDTFLYTRRLVQEGDVSVANVADAFGASVVVSGRLNVQGASTTAVLSFAGPKYPEAKDVPVTLDSSSPAILTAAIVEAVISELQLGVSASDRTQLGAVTAQTPSEPSLAAVAQGALRLPTATLGALANAVQLDPNSSWVQSEYARALALANNLPDALVASQKAIDLAPNDAEALVVRGIILQAAGDTATAVAAYDAALAINPAHAYALAGKGTLTGDAGLLESAISAYPRFVNAYLTLAQLQQNDPQTALQTLRRGAAAVPEAVALHSSLMRIAIGLGDTSGALAYLQGVLGAQTNPSASLYSLAALLPADNTAAQGIIQQGLERYPNDPTLAQAEADRLEQSGDTAGAEAALSASLAANPDSVQVANALAILQAKGGNIEAARDTLASVSAQNEVSSFNLAQLYLQAGQTDAALTTLEPLVAARPDDAEVQALYGTALGRAGRTDEANAALDRALTLDPNLASAQQAKSLLEQQNALTGGQKTELNPDAAAAFAEGQSALQTGNYGDAVSAFTKARAAQDDGLVAFYQGYALYLSGQTRAAADAYAKALETFPESDAILSNLGLAQLELGRLDLALPNLEKAVAANDQNPNAHLNLGQVNYELGRYAAAVSEWDKAVALDASLESSIADRLADARAKAGQ